MKLLISPIDEKEASEAIAGGADIVDIKNPKEGTLGASFPWIIRRIRAVAPQNIEVSCTIGDLPNLPGTSSLAALGAATIGVNYIKAGLYGVKTKDEAVYLMQNIVKAVKDFDSTIKIVATGYADAERIGTVDSLIVPKIASASECDIAMIDTALKNGQNLFDFLTIEQLKSFIDEVHSFGLKVALAGALKKEHLQTLCLLGVDIVGIRSAACTAGDRIHGRITRATVQELVQLVRNAEKQFKSGV